MSQRHCFIILTHYLTDRLAGLIERARRELSGDHDVVVLGFFPHAAPVSATLAALPGFHAVRPADIARLGYPAKGRGEGLIGGLGNPDLPVLQWFRASDSAYRTVWVFEGDADFTGSLRRLVDHLAEVPADLLATNVRPMRRTWENQKRSVVPPGWPAPSARDRLVFLPVFRASSRLLAAVDAFYAAGGTGHHEWTWPYVAGERGLGVADIGDFPLNGRRLYTSTPGLKGLFPGTFRYRPALDRVGGRRDTLYHPVKDLSLDWRGRAALCRAGMGQAARSWLANRRTARHPDDRPS